MSEHDPERGETGDRRLEQTILTLLEQRRAGATICPSEVARALGGPAWRELMDPARAAARRLMAAGEVEITQRGQVVPDPTAVIGPIRIRRAGASSPPSGLTT